MKKIFRSSLVALLLGLTASVASVASAQFQPWEGASMLDDPEWRKSFVGSYGFLSGAEPQIQQSELELLREVIDLMKVNPRAAATMLGQQVKPDGSAALDFILANLYFQDGQQELARSSYGAALEKFPDFRRAHKNLGLLLVQSKDCKRGLAHLTKAVELGDRDGRNYGLIGYCYIELESYVAAESAYRNAILHQPEVRDWKLGLARSLLAMERHKEAAALFADLIERNPEDTVAWLLQANAFIGLEQPMAAAVNLETVRAMGKAQTSSLALLGDVYMNEGMPELATSAYLEVIERDKGNLQLGTAQRAAQMLIRTRAFDQAEKVLAGIESRYGKQLSQDEQLEVLTLKAKVARARGQEEQAAKLLESIVDRDGTRGDALLELAAYHRDKGNLEKAILMIERAQKVEAFEYQALLDHAQVMVGKRDYAKAAQLLRQALAIKSEPRVEGFLARVEEASRR
jgi:tetratricopeptide (TPR) repeat protein